MTKRFVICGWCLLVLILGSLSPAISKTIRVQPGVGKLVEAVKAAAANDTLLLLPGVYKEQDVFIGKKLTILGQQFPVIDGGKKGHVIVIAADSVTVDGLQVEHSGRSSLEDYAGIRIQNARFATVRNNKLFYNTYGVYLQNASFCNVEGNEIKSDSKSELTSGNGIHAWKCHDLMVRSNSITGHRDGIYFEFVMKSHIIKNISKKNVRYGLHFMFSNNDSYSENHFENNGAGVAVMYSKQVIMINNVFRYNWGDAAYAILLKEISDSRIEHNLFQKNTVGLYMESTTNIAVMRNQFIDNGWAIKVMASCSGSDFMQNNFISNSFDVATNGTMMLNKFSRNYWDKYDGYDLDRNGIGDVPYYPVSLYAVLTEQIPTAMILYRSFLTNVMDQVEKVMPSITPDMLKDDEPRMKKWKL